MKDFWQDVRYGSRVLLKAPGLSVIAIATLAIGIGASTAVFSVVNALLFHPLPVRDPRRLVSIAYHDARSDDPHTISNPDFTDFQAQNDVLSDMTAYLIHFAGLSDGKRSERVLVTYAKGNYFASLGVKPALGRIFLPGEGETPGKDPVLVLGYAYWMRRFNGDPQIVGKQVDLDGRPFTVIGVAAKGFFGTFFIVDTNAYVPLGMLGHDAESMRILADRDERQLRVLGHLKPGVTTVQARAGLQIVADRLEKEYPALDRALQMDVMPETLARPEPESGNSQAIVAAVFMGLVALLLILTCVNVTNLLLAHAFVRSKEIAVRAALGAGRARLFRQLLTESMLLSLFGGLAGVGVGLLTMRAIESIRLPGDFPLRTDLPFDWRMFLYVACIAMACGILAGVAPEWRAARMNLNFALRESGNRFAGGGSQSRFRNALVVAQAAGSLVVLIVAGLFFRSLERAQRIELNFQPAHLLNFTMDVQEVGYDEARGTNFYRGLLDRVRALPGIESASLAYSVPMGYYGTSDEVWKEGQEGLPPSEVERSRYNKISSDYFRTMETQVVEGRVIEEQDRETSPRVTVVNEAFAQKFWPDQDPMGRRFHYGSPQAPPVEVIGVVKNIKYHLLVQLPRPMFYVPLTQTYSSNRVLQVRSALPPATLVQPIEHEVRELEAKLPVFDVLTMTETMQGGNGFFFIRLGAIFSAALGGLALLLAVAGLYGVLSHAVNQRTHEIGIRMALGAEPKNVFRLLLAQGLKLVFAGLAVGVALAAALSRFVESLLVNTAGLDPYAYAAASLLLIAVAAFACYVPARRALGVDPLVALRYE